MAVQQRAVETRQTILRAAARVIDRRGYDAATIQEILNEAGVTRGAMYFHFASKQELAKAIMLEQSAWLERTLDQHEVTFQDIVDTSYAFSDAIRHDPLFRASVRLTVERGSLETSRSMYALWVNAIETYLNHIRRRRQLTPRLRVHDTAVLVAATVTGLQLTCEALGAGEDLDRQMHHMWKALAPYILTPEALANVDLRPLVGRTHGGSSG